MSLEEAIVKHAEALNRVADAIENASIPAFVKNEKGSEPKSEKKEPAKKADTKKEAPKKEEKKAPAKKSAPKKEEKDEEEDIHQKAYYKETVQPKTREAAKLLGREIVMGILDEFGDNLETAKDLEEEQWEDYVARLEQEINDADDGDMA